MIPYSYNMVDMGGIDLAEANGTVVPGVYEKIVEAMNLCGDLILYNWKFAGINIAPSAYAVLQQVDSILINGLIQVTELDKITVIGLPPPLVPVSPLNADHNGTYEAAPPASGFNPVVVAVPTSPLEVDHNGIYETTPPIVGFNPVKVIVPERVPVIQPLIITENGPYVAPENIDGYSPINVQVGDSEKGFEVYAADASGYSRTEHGFYNNTYFVCYFDDNMSNSYTLNGVTYQYSIIAAGKAQTLAATSDVINSADSLSNALITKKGSIFTPSHYDNGSYISVAGGWVGYPHGGDIYETAAVGTSISLMLESAHETLLIFIGATSNSAGITTIDLNGNTYNIENIGLHYGAYGMYTAIEVNNNSDTNITVTFPASCWAYMSIIGLDSVH